MDDRFYCPDLIPSGAAELIGDEARHLSKVLRKGPGDLVELFDGQGRAFRARVDRVGRDRVSLEVIPEPLPDRVPARPVTLAFAPPKGERLDWLVEKATEVGVARLVPILCARSVVEPGAAKLDRLRRRVIESCKQCGRNRVPELGPIIPWGEYAKIEHAPRRRACDPSGDPDPSFGDSKEGAVAVAIGPEGGFTAEELDVARGAGWGIASLGPTILRVETAALVALARALA